MSCAQRSPTRVHVVAWSCGLLVVSVFSVFDPVAGQPFHGPFVAVGDSITQGVQAGDANVRTQPHTYASILARQLGVRLRLPLIETSPFGVVGAVGEQRWTQRSRLHPRVRGHNLAVSGADTESIWDERADALAVAEIDNETELVLFPRLGAQLDVLEALRPGLVVAWIGNNDVLSAVLSFDEYDASQMTSAEDFQANMSRIVRRLAALEAPVVMANIPSVTAIPFLFDGNDLQAFLGTDLGLPDGSATSLPVALLQRVGLGDGLIDDPNFVLDPGELAAIEARVETFNQIISTTAGAAGIPVVDINETFDALIAEPLTVDGRPITVGFLSGLLSLDAVHPSNTGHALIANAFIDRLNAEYGFDIAPLTDQAIAEIARADPHWDADGDGVVPGRPLAGAIETLAPLLGLAGDRQVDAAAARSALWALAAEGDPRSAGPLDADMAVRVFRRLYQP